MAAAEACEDDDISKPCHSESAFETVIGSHLLSNEYVLISNEGFDRQRAIFPKGVLTFIYINQPKEYTNWNTRCTAAERTIVLL